jgi:hypothetical protein
MNANLSFSLVSQQNSVGISRDDIVDILEREDDSECLMTIAEAVNSGTVKPTTESAYGRTEINPSTVNRMKSTGILPLSRATYTARMKNNPNKYLINNIGLANKTLLETKGYRVRLAYRLIRYMARIRGDVPGFGKLDTSLRGIWTMPQRFDITKGYDIGTKGIRSLLHAWAVSDNTFTYSDGAQIHTVRGITYLPPHIPDAFYIIDGATDYEQIWEARCSKTIPESYDPEGDEGLVYFCESMEMLCNRLSAHEGTELEPEAGTMGLAGLLSPRTARIAWPTVDELIMYEDSMIMYIYDEIINASSAIKIEKEIMRRFGVEREEAMDLYRMSQEVGSIVYREDMEQARQTMINRYDRIADHAESFDIRATLTALDRKTKLKGLTRTDDSNEADELRSFATRAVEFKEREK